MVRVGVACFQPFSCWVGSSVLVMVVVRVSQQEVFEYARKRKVWFTNKEAHEALQTCSLSNVTSATRNLYKKGFLHRRVITQNRKGSVRLVGRGVRTVVVGARYNIFVYKVNEECE